MKITLQDRYWTELETLEVQIVSFSRMSGSVYKVWSECLENYISQDSFHLTASRRQGACKQRPPEGSPCCCFSPLAGKFGSQEEDSIEKRE